MKFEIGKTYTSRCFNDHELIDEWKVEARTAKTVTVSNQFEGTKTFRIKVIDGNECVKVAEGFGFLRA